MEEERIAGFSVCCSKWRNEVMTSPLSKEIREINDTTLKACLTVYVIRQETFGEVRCIEMTSKRRDAYNKIASWD